MKILVFAASSSSKSINNKLVNYTGRLLASHYDNTEVDMFNIDDFELPLFSEDKEAELGQPKLAKKFLERIGNSDAVMISFAEHNGSYTAAYKNIFDWASRINPKVFQGKPMVLLATSPGPRGAANVLAAASTSAPFFDGVVKASLSVPSVYDNFDVEQGAIIDEEINAKLLTTVKSLVDSSI